MLTPSALVRDIHHTEVFFLLAWYACGLLWEKKRILYIHSIFSRRLMDVSDTETRGSLDHSVAVFVSPLKVMAVRPFLCAQGYALEIA